MLSVDWGTSTLTYAGTQRVHVRQRWADPWSYQGNIWCEEVAWSLLPAMPTATLRLDYGHVLPHGSTVWTTQSKLAIGGWYVKIEFDCADGLLIWYGFIDETADQQGGRTGSVASGRQTWIAYAMPQILATQFVTRARWWDDRNATARWSGAAVNFNDHGKPNRTDILRGSETVHVFMPTDSTRADLPEFWSTYDIVKYLETYAMPRDQGDNFKIPFRIENPELLPVWDQPTVETEGRSVLAILESLVNSSRLMQFSTLVDESTDPHTVVLKLHSLSYDDIPLFGGYTHDANTDVVNLITLDAHDTQVATQTSETGTVHQVIVKGAHRQTLGSFAISEAGDELLDEGWSSLLLDAYNAGASGQVGYGALTSEEKRSANELARSQARLNDVFRTFVITSSYGFQVGSEYVFFEGDTPLERYFPYWNSIEIPSQLPLKANYDYTGDAITDGVNDRAIQDFRSPYVLFKRPGLDQYHQAEKMAKYNADPMFSVVVGTDRDNQALTLHVHGAEQHAIAFGTFIQLPVEEGDYLIWDYRECVCTLSLQEDRYAEARYPEDVDLPSRDAIREKIFYVGPAFQLIYTLDGTTVDVDDEGALETSTGGWLRDDRDQLEAIAKIAATFWLVPRKVLRLHSARPSATLAVGQLVDIINEGTEHESTIGTVISEIRLSVLLGEDSPSDTAHYSLVTALGEFDPVAFIPARR